MRVYIQGTHRTVFDLVSHLLVELDVEDIPCAR